ncbi:MAG: hypothetical protein HYW48_05345 [Deltaproteobacteria bacterium]|nr:hypothetical protein [Deltaproteobacteria bacterium]
MRKTIIFISLVAMAGLSSCKPRKKIETTKSRPPPTVALQQLPEEGCVSFNLVTRLPPISSAGDLKIGKVILGCNRIVGINGGVCRARVETEVMNENIFPDNYWIKMCSRNNPTDCEIKISATNLVYFNGRNPDDQMAYTKACVEMDRVPANNMASNESFNGLNLFCGTPAMAIPQDVPDTTTVQQPKLTDEQANKLVASEFAKLAKIEQTVESRARSLCRTLKMKLANCSSASQDATCSNLQNLSLMSILNLGEQACVEEMIAIIDTQPALQSELCQPSQQGLALAGGTTSNLKLTESKDSVTVCQEKVEAAAQVKTSSTAAGQRAIEAQMETSSTAAGQRAIEAQMETSSTAAGQSAIEAPTQQPEEPETEPVSCTTSNFPQREGITWPTSPESYQSGASVTSNCDANKYTGSLEVVCSTGSWIFPSDDKPDNDGCQPKSCSGLGADATTLIVNGTWGGNNTATHEQQITGACNQNFESTVAILISCEFGNWTNPQGLDSCNPTPSTTPADCTNLGSSAETTIQNGHWGTVTGALNNENVTGKCNSEYSATMLPQITCSNGAWTNFRGQNNCQKSGTVASGGGGGTSGGGGGTSGGGCGTSGEGGGTSQAISLLSKPSSIVMYIGAGLMVAGLATFGVGVAAAYKHRQNAKKLDAIRKANLTTAAFATPEIDSLAVGLETRPLLMEDMKTIDFLRSASAADPQYRVQTVEDIRMEMEWGRTSILADLAVIESDPKTFADKKKAVQDLIVDHDASLPEDSEFRIIRQGKNFEGLFELGKGFDSIQAQVSRVDESIRTGAEKFNSQIEIRTGLTAAPALGGPPSSTRVSSVDFSTRPLSGLGGVEVGGAAPRKLPGGPESARRPGDASGSSRVRGISGIIGVGAALLTMGIIVTIIGGTGAGTGAYLVQQDDIMSTIDESLGPLSGAKRAKTLLEFGIVTRLSQ